MVSDNISYYNKNAEQFIRNTKSADMSILQNIFIKHVAKGGRILDLGCGSGRDSLFFKHKHYDVYAIDASIEMVRHCQPLLGERVLHVTFEDYQSDILYDGIWACASLIHVDRAGLADIIIKYTDMLKPCGVFLMSFKQKKDDYFADGRSFTCFTKQQLAVFLSKIDCFTHIEFIETRDVRPGREDEKWISAIGQK